MEKTITFKEKMQNILKWIYSKLNIFLYCYLALVVLVVLFLLPQGHDLAFHLQRFDAVIQEFANYGISAIPTRIYHVTCNGYGYASPLFYGDIFMWPFAGLCALFNIPAIWGYKIMLASTFVAVFFIAKYSFKLVVKKEYQTLVLFIFITNATIFGNAIFSWVGRAYAMMFAPLTICSFISLMKEDAYCLRNSILMGVGVAGLLFSNVIDAVIVVLSLFVLFLFCLKDLTWKKAGFLALSVAVFVVVSAWFIFPMLEQMTSQTFFVTSDEVNNQINDLGRYTVPLIGFLFPSELSDDVSRLLGMEGPSGYYFSHIIVYLFLFGSLLFYKIKKGKTQVDGEVLVYNDKRLTGGFLTLIILFVIFQTKLFPHSLLNRIFGVIQFPLRVGIVMTILLSILGVTIFIKSKNKILFTIFITLNLIYTSLFAFTSIGVPIMKTILSGSQYYASYSYVLENSIGSGGEYLPVELLGEGNDRLAWCEYITERGDVVICSDKDVSLNSEKTFDKVTVTFANNNNNSTFELPYFYYKGYAAINTETGEEYEVKKSKNGLVEITGLPESGTVEVYYKGTTIQTVSEIVSGVGLVAIVGTIIFIVVKNKKRLICVEDNVIVDW